MNKGRNKKAKNSQIPMFIAKLLEILENKQIADTVSWTTTRDSFDIKNISRFTEEILPLYFKHHNFASFIRQLNMYGFKKVRHPDGDNVYMNENFKEANRHLLSNINRKIKDDKQQTLVLYSGAKQSKQDGRVGKQIQDLKTKQKNLQEMCKRFLIQNQKLLEENQSLVQKMEKDSREKEKRLQEFLIYLLSQKNSRALNEQAGQLSIMNGQAPYERQINLQDKASDPTPLEVLGDTMDQNESFKKMKSLLNNAYNRRSSKRKDNYTIISPRKQDDFNLHDSDLLSEGNPLHHDLSEPISQIPLIPNNEHNQQDNKSFLSINDFINAEDYQDFNLQQSN